MYLCVFLFFFFKQKTAYEMRISDWSSDVCSSDLIVEMRSQIFEVTTERRLRQVKGFGRLSHALEPQQRLENRQMEERQHQTASAAHGGIGGDPSRRRKRPML